MASAVAVHRLERLIASPRTVASVLNWPMNLWHPILSVHLGKKSIDLALISHPGVKENGDHYNSRRNQHKYGSSHCWIQSLPSIPLEQQETIPNPKFVKPQVIDKLLSVVENYKVCGLVVSWPGQNGGASSGSVLHTLEQIMQDANIVNPSRPACVWGSHQNGLNHDDDQNTPEKKITATFGYQLSLQSSISIKSKANQRPYHEDGMCAAAVAADYLRTHWPDLTLKFGNNSPMNDHESEEEEPVDVRDWRYNMGSISESDEPLWTQPKESSKSPEESNRSTDHFAKYSYTDELDEVEAVQWTNASAALPSNNNKDGVSEASHPYHNTGEINDSDFSRWVAGPEKSTLEESTHEGYVPMQGEIEESEEYLWTQPVEDSTDSHHEQKRPWNGLFTDQASTEELWISPPSLADDGEPFRKQYYDNGEIHEGSEESFWNKVQSD